MLDRGVRVGLQDLGDDAVGVALRSTDLQKAEAGIMDEQIAEPAFFAFLIDDRLDVRQTKRVLKVEAVIFEGMDQWQATDVLWSEERRNQG